MKKLQFDFNGNMGGISRMFAIPLTSFRRIRRDYTHNLNYLEVINRDDIIDICFTEGTDTFTEDYEDGLYNIIIGGVVPKRTGLAKEVLNKLESDIPWLVLFMDNNDNLRLAGNENFQLAFRRTDTTGQTDSRNQLSFQFFGANNDPVDFITLSDMDDL